MIVYSPFSNKYTQNWRFEENNIYLKSVRVKGQLRTKLGSVPNKKVFFSKSYNISTYFFYRYL